MNNDQVKIHLAMVKSIVGDNDEDPNREKVPCGVVFKEWDHTEIDNLPEDFDWQEFWHDCKEEYPLHSVAGSIHYHNPETIITLEHAQVPIQKFIAWRDRNVHGGRKPKVLEIGFGFGGAADRFTANGFDYTGIDYVPSRDMSNVNGRFITIKESGIPKELINEGETFDVIYSENVFQHMTRQQRLDYYNQAYKVLRKGGIFHFDLFCKNAPTFRKLYSVKEEKTLDYACNFFGVHTYVPYRTEVAKALRSAGFKLSEINVKSSRFDKRTDVVTFLAVKK